MATERDDWNTNTTWYWNDKEGLWTTSSLNGSLTTSVTGSKPTGDPYSYNQPVYQAPAPAPTTDPAPTQTQDPAPAPAPTYTPDNPPEYLSESPTAYMNNFMADPAANLPGYTLMDPYMMTSDENQTVDSSAGMLTGDPTIDAPRTAWANTAETPDQFDASTYQAKQISQLLEQMQAANGQLSPEAIMQAVQGVLSDGAYAQAAQGEAAQVGQVDPRTLQNGEMVQAATVADVGGLVNPEAAQTDFVANMQAAQGQLTPEATVQGQLAELMKQFEGGEIPAWAAPLIRNAEQTMAARGMGASSMASAASVQAAMEAALPIAQQDAQAGYGVLMQNLNNEQQARLENMRTNAQIDLANLSNRQQASLMKAQYEAALKGQELTNRQQANIINASKISEIANMNFTAEQERALMNAQLTQGMNLANLNNRQAVAIANAAAVANMDMTNLNNRQQANVLNAQAFLQMDMTNLANEQQAAVINQQAHLQALLSDQSAVNAAKQFNATSQTQVDQFFASLSAQISQFNATQANAMRQFNIGNELSVDQFNAAMSDARERFNAENALVIEQSNVNWLRQINTANTAALNSAMETNVQNMFNMSSYALDALWQEHRDLADQLWVSSENSENRRYNLAMSALEYNNQMSFYNKQQTASLGTTLGSLAAGVLGGIADAIF